MSKDPEVLLNIGFAMGSGVSVSQGWYGTAVTLGLLALCGSITLAAATVFDAIRTASANGGGPAAPTA